MSHELRTPLQAALGFAQLVRSGVYGPINEAQAEALGRVERSQTHLARLIDDILDFARLEAGRVRIALEPVAVDDVFRDLAPLVEPQASAKNDRRSRSAAARRRCAVEADRHRLRQILVNLVGNADQVHAGSGRRFDVAALGDGRARVVPRERHGHREFQPTVCRRFSSRSCRWTTR